MDQVLSIKEQYVNVIFAYETRRMLVSDLFGLFQYYLVLYVFLKCISIYIFSFFMYDFSLKLLYIPHI